MIDVVVSWSGGKDCAMALERVLGDLQYRVVSLLTTINTEHDRVMMHGVRQEVIQRQAQLCGLPLHTVALPNMPSNDQYNAAMNDAMQHFYSRGVRAVVFGDLFLEGIRAYRETRLQEAKMQGVFPLWQQDTKQLAHDFVARGCNAVVTCVDTTQLDGDFSGRTLDASFFNNLPSTVDPCGENGEYHSLVTHVPYFKQPLDVTSGEQHHDGRFTWTDFSLISC